MAATVQINPTSRTSRRRIPSDPLDESIYNMVLRPGAEDRPPPLFKSKFSQRVRSEHLKARRTMSLPTAHDQIARSAVGLTKAARIVKAKVSNKEKDQTTSPIKSTKSISTRVSKSIKSRNETKIAAPKAVSTPISKPTSGRIAMAAERRSNANTPVVADPTAWDHVAANEAESMASSSPLRKEGCMSSGVNYEEVPEELIEQWEPFEQDLDESGRPIRKNSPPPTEMETGIVRKHGIGKKAPIGRVFAQQPGIASPAQGSLGSNCIGGGNRRRMLPEAERFAVLAGLKANYQSLLGIYNRLPVATDTISKVNRKTSIEKQLKLLEDDIKKFSHPNIIIDEGI